MRNRKTTAIALAVVLGMAAGPSSLLAAAQQDVTIGGTAKREANKPYSDYKVRARDAQSGQIAATGLLDPNAQFTVTGLPPAHYVVELLNKDGKVVCSEGPFNLTQQLLKNDVNIDCGKVPVAWWLIGAAAAAGITAGVVSGASGTASPSR